MPSTRSLLKTLQEDFSFLAFVQGDQFHWSPETKTITYTKSGDIASLLHEVAHAALEHDQYVYDIELLKMEREAWDYVTSHLAQQYNVTIEENDVETMLNTYRDWLHNRSLCPQCTATGIQQDSRTYRCFACSGQWRVNEARSCALRRYRVETKSTSNK